MATSLDPATQAGIGAFAGLVEVTVQQPLHTLKNFVQDGRSLPLNPVVWYRGWGAGVLMCVPMTVVQFGAARRFERAFEVDVDVTRNRADDTDSASSSSTACTATEETLPPSRRLAAAWCAGALSACLIQPLDLCQIQQQKFGGSIVGTARRIINEHGFGILSRGSYLTVGREAFYSCGYLCAVPVLRDFVKVNYPDIHSQLGDKGVFAGCAIVSGVGAAVATQPMDMVKTLMQSNLGKGDRASNATGASSASTLKNISTSVPIPTGGEGGARFGGLSYAGTALAAVKEGGLKSLWKGIGARGARIVGATFILSAVNETMGAALAERNESKGD